MSKAETIRTTLILSNTKIHLALTTNGINITQMNDLSTTYCLRDKPLRILIKIIRTTTINNANLLTFPMKSMRIVLIEKPFQQDKTSELTTLRRNSNSPLKIPPLIQKPQEILLIKMIALIKFSLKESRKRNFLPFQTKAHF